MASDNTDEEQAIAFLLVCVANSRKGKINWPGVLSQLGGDMTESTAKRYYRYILKNSKKFDISDKYPDLRADPSWVSVTAEDEDDGVFVDSPCDGNA